jgi:PAS domain S-box-containing protein
MLSRTCLVVQELVPNASVAVHLRPERTKAALVGTNSAVLEAEADDETVGDGGDLVNWVIENGRLLSLQPGDLHFAARHGLSLPHPPPAAWLGIPLNPGGETVGALVLQRYEADLPFLQWQQELLVTLAGHVSAAIRNARLYSEVLRLYNLSDAALGQRLRQLQALLNSTEDGVLMLGKTGQILLVNPPAAELLGAPQATLQDAPIEAHEAADPLGFAPDELGALLESLAQGSPREGQRHVYAHYASGNQNKAGERRFLERSETPVVDADGNVIGWLLMLRDVTEEQERNEWRTNVTRMIVHDLRNPVTTLASTVDLIESAIAGDAVAAAQSYVAQARESCAEMLDMIDSLMDMTRLEAGQLNLDAEAMRVPSLAAQVIERLQPLARRRGIQLTLDVAAELPAVWADREMLRRVYVNLLDNALKFTPSQGRVTVQLSAEPAVDGHENGVRCTVVDTGPGIPAEERKRVFERFTRVNIGGGQVRGTGLGLTFCKLTIEAHGGTIWIEEADSGGARFVFTLPGIPRFEAPTV